MMLSVISPLRMGDPPGIIGPFETEIQVLKVYKGTANEAVNIGLEMSRGDAFSFVASGDTLEGLDEAMALLTRRDVVYGDSLIIEGSKYHRYITPKPDELATHLAYNCVATGGFFFRREVFEQVGGFDCSMRSAADYDFLIRAVKARFRFQKMDRVTYKWIKTPGSLSDLGRRDAELVRAKHRDFVKPLGSLGAMVYYSRRFLQGQLRP